MLRVMTSWVARQILHVSNHEQVRHHDGLVSEAVTRSLQELGLLFGRTANDRCRLQWVTAYRGPGLRVLLQEV